MRDTFHWLPCRQRIHYRLSTIVWRRVLAPTYLLGLFILTSSCTGRQSLALPPEVILSCLMLAQLLNSGVQRLLDARGQRGSWMPSKIFCIPLAKFLTTFF